MTATANSRSYDLAMIGSGGAAFAAAIERLARRCTHLCMHVDLDVLDPRFVPSASTPSANGLTIEAAAAAVAAVGEGRGGPGSGPRVVATKSRLYPDTRHLMGWRVGGHGRLLPHDEDDRDVGDGLPG